MTQRTPNLAEVIRAGIKSALESVHTAIPGKVVRYDAAKQLADVKPLIQAAYEDETGARQVAALPIITNCPVQFPGGGGFTLTFPIVAGDTGLVVFSEASLDKWLSSAGADVDPAFDHRHHLADGVFIPGVRPFGAARSTTPSSAVNIGVDGGSFQGPALGADLDTFLGSVLKVWLDAHVHSASGSGPPSAPSPTPPTLESDTVKITP